MISEDDVTHDAMLPEAVVSGQLYSLALRRRKVWKAVVKSGMFRMSCTRLVWNVLLRPTRLV